MATSDTVLVDVVRSRCWAAVRDAQKAAQTFLRTSSGSREEREALRAMDLANARAQALADLLEK